MMYTENWESKLTGREYEILMLLSYGKTNRMIAGELSIAPGTVKIHVRSLFRKMGVSSRLQAAVIAAKHRVRLTADYQHCVA